MRSKRLIMMVPLVCAAWLHAGAAGAVNGMVVVNGGAGEHERTTIGRAIDEALRAAGWSLPAKPFAKKDVDRLLGCGDVRAPWTCVAPSITAAGVDNILVVSIETSRADSGAPLVIITGQLIVTSLPSFALRKRFCEHCADDKLAQAGQDLAHQLLREMASRSGRTAVHIQSTPTGADITLDGIDVGATEATFNTFPGHHAIAVKKDGFATEIREFTAEDGKTAELTITLRPSRVAAPTPAVVAHPESRRWLAPTVLGAGGVLLVSGGYLLYLGARTLGPDDRYEPTRATTVGIVAGLAGVGAVGAGLYLLWHHDDGPTVTPTAGGAVVGWSGRFR